MNSVFDSRILNLVIFFPLLVGALVAFLPKEEKGQIRVVTLAGMIGSFLTTLWAWIRLPASRVLPVTTLCGPTCTPSPS